MDYEINSEVLRNAQLVQLEILIEFDRICKLNNLKYQLFAGTLLGAIRHNGFIPWDDDIDVAMLRSDYEILLDICNKHLSHDYFLQTYKTDSNFHRQFARIRKNNTKYLQKGYKSLAIHHGVFIDVFPLDNVKPNSTLEKIRCKVLLIMSYINILRNIDMSYQPNIIKRIIGKTIKITNRLVSKSTFDQVTTKIMKMFENENTEYINHLTDNTTKKMLKRFLVKKEDFEKMIEWEFEEYKFPIPRNYHSYLTSNYGDYMILPPKEQQKPHHGIIEIEFGDKIS